MVLFLLFWREMITSIDLYDQLTFKADKVNDIFTNYMLTTKFLANAFSS